MDGAGAFSAKEFKKLTLVPLCREVAMDGTSDYGNLNIFSKGITKDRESTQHSQLRID